MKMDIKKYCGDKKINKMPKEIIKFIKEAKRQGYYTTQIFNGLKIYIKEKKINYNNLTREKVKYFFYMKEKK